MQWRRWIGACLAAALVVSPVLLGGCKAMQTAASVPEKTIRAVAPGGNRAAPQVDPVELQQSLARFSDEFLMRIIIGVDRLKRGTNTIEAAEALKWKIAFGSQITSIASGPNAMANLLDMTVLVTVVRASIEDYWQPKVYGESTTSLLEGCRQSEADVWGLAHKVLTPAQMEELRQAVVKWHNENQAPEGILAARAVGFAAEVAKANRAAGTGTGITETVFNLLTVDPLSGLDPAVREIAQTRLFAERALFVMQKMPTLVRWQTELLSINTLNLPQVTQVMTNTEDIAASVQRFAVVAEKLPGQISAEREAILKELQTQEKELTPLVAQVKEALGAGTQLSASLDTTLKTLDALMKRFGVGEPKAPGPPKTNSEPFRIESYTEAAGQLTVAAKQLDELLKTLDRTVGSTNIAQAGIMAKTSAKEMVNVIFWRAVLVILAALMAALLYRFVTRHHAFAGRKPSQKSDS